MNNTTDRIGDWGITATGRQYWPLDMRPTDISIHDIAHSLSHICRFGGHTLDFYSVAEHSVYVSYCVPPEHALVALLHDATEAYVTDVPRPLKRGLGKIYEEIEAGAWFAIATHFNLPLVLPECVKHADNAVLMAEKHQIMCSSPHTWSLNVDPAPVTIECHRPHQAMTLFMARYNEILRADRRSEMREWLLRVKAKSGIDKARDIMVRYGNAQVTQKIPSSFFGAVISACRRHLEGKEV